MNDREIRTDETATSESGGNNADTPAGPREEFESAPQARPLQHEIVRPHDYINPALQWLWVHVFKNAILWTTLSTVVIAIATVMYVHVSSKQLEETKKSADAAKSAADTASGTLGEIQKQTRLMLQQVEGTMAAVVYFYPSLETSPYRLFLNVQNGGRVIAHNVAATVTVEVLNLPDGRITGRPFTYNMPPETLGPGSPQSNVSIDKRIDVPEWNALTERGVNELRRAVRIRGHFTYEDGFGRTITKSRCEVRMVAFFVSADPTKNLSPRAGRVDNVECSEFSARLREALATKRLVEKEAQKERH